MVMVGESINCETGLCVGVLWASSPPPSTLGTLLPAVSQRPSSTHIGRTHCGGPHREGSLRLLILFVDHNTWILQTPSPSWLIYCIRGFFSPSTFFSCQIELHNIQNSGGPVNPAHVKSCLACRDSVRSSGTVHTSKTFNAKNRRNAAWRTKVVLCDENGP